MAKRKTRRTTKALPETQQRVQLIVSDETNPALPMKPGMKFEVVSVSLVAGETLKPARIAARLCGGTSTCIALVEIE